MQPLTGLQKAAWWSVPGLGVVALFCASTIGILFINKPPTVSDTPSPSRTRSPGEVAQSTNAVLDPGPVSGQPGKRTTVKVAETQIVEGATPAPNSEPEQSTAPESAAPDVATKTAEPESDNAAIMMSLTCTDGKIVFEGKQDLKFVDGQPSMEITEDGGVAFAHLFFNGTDQSVELPPIARAQGTLELVVKMPPRDTCVLLDSSAQRLTVRKNKGGLRWRVGGLRKPAKIRDIDKPVDFRQWHHIAITWKSGDNAILYVDGVEHDRYAYVHEQPRSSIYKRIVLGRTRGSSGRFHECRVNKFVVYDQPLPVEDIAELNQSVRQKYPFIFK